ncbi:replicative DNA helicase [Geobacillus phage vB_GthS_PT9.1]|nr:replicative DNA helicase [Geobacillus phage vB_GthS_PT9.1]
MVNNAEQSVLHCILKDNELLQEIKLEPEHFLDIRHQRIYKAMQRLNKNNEIIDVVSLSAQLGDELLFVGGYDYLNELLHIVAKPEHIYTYERYVLENYKKVRIKELAKQIKETNDYEEIQRITHEMNELTLDEQKNDFDLIDILAEIEEEANTERNGISGISTGFTELDTVLDGWLEEELTIIGARPSMGKTAFALALATNAMQKEHCVTFFSLEMSAKSLLKRMICSIGRIHATKMKDPLKRFNEADWRNYRNAQSFFSVYKNFLDIDDRSKVKVQDIWARVKQNVKKAPDKRHLVIIDYLTLIEGSGRRERHLEVGEISRGLKRMARELKVSVIVLAQLNRAVEQRQDKRPIMSDLRDSGEIEQDADKILFLHRDDYYDSEAENKNIIEVIVAKHRNGPLEVVPLFFDRSTQTFANLEVRQ